MVATGGMSRRTSHAYIPNIRPVVRRVRESIANHGQGHPWGMGTKTFLEKNLSVDMFIPEPIGRQARQVVGGLYGNTESQRQIAVKFTCVIHDDVIHYVLTRTLKNY